MSGAGYIGSLAGPEYVSKVNRVLDAARAWRKLHGGNLKGKWFSAQELSDALDALDAPRERYTVRYYEMQSYVMDGDKLAARCEDHAQADRIAAALNAAECKP